MPIDPRRDRPGASTPSNLPETAGDETGNEDPGAELTELPEHEKQKRAVGNHPMDPNSMPARIGLPAGDDPEPPPISPGRGRRAATR